MDMREEAAAKGPPLARLLSQAAVASFCSADSDYEANDLQQSWGFEGSRQRLAGDGRIRNQDSEVATEGG